MRILVANDDGIQAAGIKALVESLSQEHEVHVVAPTKERSAMGHALTLHRPLRVEKLPENYFKNVKHSYTIDGTPTDCIKIALNKILDFTPDLVVSGINHGPNMGKDIIYSGTVSIAMEGSIYGIKSIAFSLNDMKMKDFEEEAKYVPQIVNQLLALGDKWNSDTLFNVNIPSLEGLPDNKPKGIKFAPLGRRMYTDDYDHRVDPRGRSYYWLAGEIVEKDRNPQSDVVLCKDGHITITPVTLDFQNQDLLSEMCE